LSGLWNGDAGIVKSEPHHFEIRYANGKIDFARSLKQARNKVFHEAGHDDAPTGLLPAEIWKTRIDEVIGRGEHAETVDEAIPHAGRAS
jgi:hypothetical protein